MKLSSISACIALTIFLNGCSSSETTPSSNSEGLTQYVNPFIGTGGHGHTYPGASMPFGMVQLSPDTRLDGWDGCSGYHYTDSIVYGFSHTHLSGTGVSDYGDILLMPFTKESADHGIEGPYHDQASSFDKASEQASPGYYAMHLNTYDIDVALTSTYRAGFHQYTYKADQTPQVLIDLKHRDKLLDADLQIVSDTEVAGKRISKAWAEEQHVYFVAEFSRPFNAHQLDSAKIELEDDTQFNAAATTSLSFEKGEDPLLVRVGISAVSIENARENLKAEIKSWDFEAIRQQANDTWEQELGKIEVEGGTSEQREIFYTALYHSFLNPNLFSDVNGEYRGTDLKVHQAEQGEVYTIFSLWDTFRGTHPLFTITQQDRTNAFINTFLAQYQNGGQLPVWELSANYTGCMIGYHSIPVIADAYAKGIRGYDANLALEAMQHSAMQDHLGLSDYKNKGFIAAGDEAESVSKTLEYAYDDWCIGYMAQAMDHGEAYKYLRRGQNYKNLFDPNTGFMRARKEANWYGPFDPAEVNFNYTEANAWQYSLFAPQDIQGMIQIMGGADRFEQHVDNLFTASEETSGRDQADITGLIGQYAHGNEPSHHMAYLYNYIGKPWKTQERVRQIMDELYSTQPDGLSGNEDCGQMSSWYVLSAMGFYSVTPGLPYYTIGTPIFDKVTLHLENGKTFEIIANKTADDDHYIQSALLNGAPYTQSYLNHEAIMEGGTLTFEMGNQANESWGSNEGDMPIASITENPITPVPYCVTSGKTFTDTLNLSMGIACEDCQILFTLDGSIPEPDNAQVYEGPLVLEQTTTVMLRGISSEGRTGKVVNTEFLKIKGGRSIELKQEYANQYAAGGQNGLIDYIRGSENFRTGDWQGYWDTDFEAIVDLGEVEQVAKLNANFLQDIKSWIFFPTSVEFAISTDGENFTVVDLIETTHPDNEYGAFVVEYTAKTPPTNARYVRVKAKSYGQCPEWHLGAGNPTWIFIDEISIE